MGIYIKNIKKPWRCDECMFTDNLDECIFLKTDADIDGLNIDCPIVEITDRKTEPQMETEIAKAIVHKMIDDAVIAEDAYPDLRQKMHDAVDEYEPQTDCAWSKCDD